MPSGWYSCNSYAISKNNIPQGFVLFVQFVFSKIKRQILPDSNNFDLRQKHKRTENHDGFPLDRYGHTVRAFLFFFQTEEKRSTSYSPTQRYFPYPHL